MRIQEQKRKVSPFAGSVSPQVLSRVAHAAATAHPSPVGTTARRERRAPTCRRHRHRGARVTMIRRTCGSTTSTTRCNYTQWACDQAAAARSVAQCEKCTFWQPPSLVPQHPHEVRAARPRPTTAWFMCVNRPQSTQLLFARHSTFIQLVQVAIRSAIFNAPSLAPYVLYMHSEGQRFDEPDELSTWLRAQGVRVVNSRLTFAEHIPRIRWRMKTLTGIPSPTLSYPLLISSLRLSESSSSPPPPARTPCAHAHDRALPNKRYRGLTMGIAPLGSR